MERLVRLEPASSFGDLDHLVREMLGGIGEGGVRFFAVVSRSDKVKGEGDEALDEKERGVVRGSGGDV